ncbi:MAG: DNA polymerase III subunit delta [Anaerolineales bacterium]|nr:DNA polymerase III subunit delta [Anaerolineales bacterium]
MSTAPPVVYILHGEDEFAIAQAVATLEEKMGEETTAVLNSSRLDGRSLSLNELKTAVSALPFLSARRLVVVTQPSSSLNSQGLQNKFKQILEGLPPTTGLILIEYKTLRKNNWLLKWAQGAGSKAFVRVFPTRKGGAMARWIQEQAQAAGGQITPQGAALLASLVGEDARLAYQEVQKLVAYTNYDERPIDAEDVENLTAFVGQGDIFALVDALGNQNARIASGTLRQLLEKQDALPVFGMIVRQIRLLLLAREVLDAGGREVDVAREIKIHPFVAGKITTQSRHFTMQELERVYHHLLDIDEAIKTGKMAGDLALDTLVAELTHQ